MKNIINRQKYKDIKRYDHNQMETFAKSLYEQGLKAGAEQALAQVEPKEIGYDTMRERVLGIKGIGAVKADEVMAVVKEVIENE